MMSLESIAAVGLIGLFALVLASHYLLRAWQGWLEVRKLELTAPGPRSDTPTGGPAGSRIELADLRERIRKLEAIAAGIDL